MKAKEIYDLIRMKPYKDGEKMIKEYAERIVKKRDEQWFNTMKNLGYLSSYDEFNDIIIELPEPEIK